jgi:hypothetical protein
MAERPDLPELERARLRALVDRDEAAAVALHAEDYELITPGGVTYTRAEYLGGIVDGTLRYRRFEPVGEVRARAHDDTAIVRYRVAIEIEFPDGRDEGTFWHTDYWERRDGRWQAVWSHATRIRAAD